MKLFEFTDYRAFIVATVKSLPKSGRGEYLRIAKFLNIHTSTLSQVLAGTKQFTPDQAAALAEYYGFNELETEYLFVLVHLERAGSERLRNFLRKKLRSLSEKSNHLAAVVPGKKILSPEEKAIFYSNWFYPAIWALTSIEGYQEGDAIAKYLKLPKKLVNQVLAFLLSTGLCEQDAGKLRPGTSYVHLESESPFIGRHHAMWRQRAIERHPVLTESEIAYSSPMSISLEDANQIRKLVIEWVARVNQIREKSSCEALYFINIDWIKI